MYIVVAGESQINGQKNHNLLKGIEASGRRDEAYVFLDADIAFDRNWIRNLVQPLSDESVTCATGFRLVSLSEGGIARCVHAFMVTMQWAWMHFKPIRTVWGGSVAIRRHEFEGLKVADSWRNTVVDDISLTQRVSAARTKVLLVPLCVAETDDAITSLRGTFEWFRRQSQFIKYYMRPAWLIAIFTYSFVSLSMLALPFLVFACTFCPQPNVIVLTSSVGVLSVLFMLWALLSRDKKSNTYNGVLWFLMSPFCFAVASFSGAAGGFSDTVTWSGVAYKVGFRGTVKRITRI
jgi:ceramide glucosyltransferase